MKIPESPDIRVHAYRHALKGSVMYHHLVLSRWANGNNVNLGKSSYQGHSLRVGVDTHARCATFIVESRACETGRPRKSLYPYVYNNNKARHRAFKAALEDYKFRLAEPTRRLRELMHEENKNLCRCGLDIINYKE